jgi:hypothetical protein
MSETRLVPPAEITRSLARDERLIWWDRPIPALLARREITIGILMGLFFLAFSIFWLSMAFRAPGPFFLFGVPFVFIGLWMASAPIRAYVRAGSMLYALTDRRAMLLTGSTTRTFPLDQLDFVETKTFADGTGHVEFYQETNPYAWTRSYPTGVQKIGFLAIADAEKVARKLLELRDTRRAPAKGS